MRRDIPQLHAVLSQKQMPPDSPGEDPVGDPETPSQFRNDLAGYFDKNYNGTATLLPSAAIPKIELGKAVEQRFSG